MDKLAKVRAEIERLHEESRNKKGALYYRKALRTVLYLIDSLQEEPASEDLEKEIDSYFAKWLQGASDEGCFNPDSQLVSIYDCHRIARHFANWQKQKDESYTKSMYKVGINTGKELMKQQLMTKAVDAVVKVDAGGYPYIDRTIELYDYDKDIPLAKKGDKYKLILIKED